MPTQSGGNLLSEEASREISTGFKKEKKKEKKLPAVRSICDLINFKNRRSKVAKTRPCLAVCVWRHEQGWHVCKAKKSDHIHPIFQTALASSNTSRSNSQYKISVICLNSISGTSHQSVSVRSPSTLHSNKTITICIRHPNLGHPWVDTKTVGERAFSYAGRSVWTICLKHSSLTFFLLF